MKNKIKRRRSLWTEQTEVIFMEMWEEKIDDLREKKTPKYVEKFYFSFF